MTRIVKQTYHEVANNLYQRLAIGEPIAGL